jgi:hypothetical protein
MAKKKVTSWNILKRLQGLSCSGLFNIFFRIINDLSDLREIH